jgi:hypothetical protein
MRLRTFRKTPLWFDLLLATGAIALAYRLDQVILGQPTQPSLDRAWACSKR